jgi:uncharacterized hydantoinase/oxoprolinase family protein
MIGRDGESRPPADWRGLAQWLARAQLRRIEDACDRILFGDPLPAGAPVVIAGVGRFMAADLAERLGRSCLGFASLLPEDSADPERVSDCAPAVAVAWLARRAGD